MTPSYYTLSISFPLPLFYLPVITFSCNQPRNLNPVSSLFISLLSSVPCARFSKLRLSQSSCAFRLRVGAVCGRADGRSGRFGFPLCSKSSVLDALSDLREGGKLCALKRSDECNGDTAQT